MRYSRLVSMVNGLLLSSNVAALSLPVLNADADFSQNTYWHRQGQDLETTNLYARLPVLAQHKELNHCSMYSLERQKLYVKKLVDSFNSL